MADRLLAIVYDDDRKRISWKGPAFEPDRKWLQNKPPGMEFYFGSHAKGEDVWIVSAASDVEPGQTYLFDRKAKKLALQYRVRDEIPCHALAHMGVIHYPSCTLMRRNAR